MDATSEARTQGLRVMLRFGQATRGQGMAEYGLILALVAVVVIVALTTMGTNIRGVFNTVSGAV